jgi:hypothetical protein
VLLQLNKEHITRQMSQMQTRNALVRRATEVLREAYPNRYVSNPDGDDEPHSFFQTE